MAASSSSSSAVPSGSKLTRDHSLVLEEHTLKTPYELLRRNFRAAQRTIEKDFAALSTLVDDVRALEAADGGGAEDDGAGVRERLGAGHDRVRGLKRKLADLLPSPAHPPVLRHRLDHLSQLETFTHSADPGFEAWSDKRLARYLVDHLVRSGRFETARALARSTGVEALVDVELFVELARIEASLDAGGCAEALAWCGENRGSLKKTGDSLEFALRLQEYTELCRARSAGPALAYLRKHLAPWAPSHMADLRRSMGLLACDEAAARRVPAYAAMYNRARWQALRTRFRTTFLATYALPTHASLGTALAVGLSAFKLPFCSPASHLPSPSPSSDDDAAPRAREAGDPARSCPTCDAFLGALAKELPASHHMTSVVVCRLSGRVMDDSDDGRPMCFPNGFVYSYGALRDMADANDGVVRCPRSGLECAFDDLRRVFIS